MSSPITREVALRIGLAARALPGIEARALAPALAERFGLPLTEAALSKVTVSDLKALIQGDDVVEPDYSSEQLKEAVRLLWGEGVESDIKLPTQAFTEGDMPGSIRVAIASNSEENLDGHFGSCERFLIYQVAPAEARLIDIRSTADAEQAEDRNAARSALIADCQVVYVHSIGGPAAAKVVRAGVHPVKVPQAAPARETLAQLQTTLQAPPPWLAKIMGVKASTLSRFADLAEEEEA
jgi:nitrogen fixation protein NifX